MNLIELVQQNQHIQKWQQNLNKASRQLILGLSGTSKALVMSSAPPPTTAGAPTQVI